MANLNVKQLFTNILNKLKANDDKIGDTSMGTTATTITGAIAEHETDISNLNSNLTLVQYYNYNQINSFFESDVGTFYDGQNSNQMYKFGNIVVFYAYIKLTQNTLAWTTTIMKIKKHPPRQYIATILGGELGAVGDDGTVRLGTNHSANDYVRISGVYICR